MRTSNYRKQIQLNNKTVKTLKIAGIAGIFALVLFFFAFFHVSKVEVIGIEHYSEKEIKKMVLKGPFASNSILAPVLLGGVDLEKYPYIDSLHVTRSGSRTLVISVREKKIVGCIPYLDSYIYFDRNGVFVSGSTERDTAVPFFDGIEVKKVVQDEKLPIKSTVMNTAVALYTIFSKNDMVPDHIQFDDSYNISLLYGDITVYLGKDVYLEDKMTRAIAILPQITGEKGILHMENITDTVKTVTFESDQKQTGTAEEWTGGYDENGDYTGDGEYDEEGNYVGPQTSDTGSENSSETDTSGDEGDTSDYTDENTEDTSGDYSDESSYDGTEDTSEDYQDYSDSSEEDYGDYSYSDEGYYDDSGDYSDEYSSYDESGYDDSSYNDGYTE